MSTLAIDTFETYPEDISILLDANLGTLGDFIATYHDRFDEGRWKAIFTFIRDRAIKLIRQRLDCMEELRIFIRTVIESATIDEIRKNYPDVAAALNEIVELLLVNAETPDALAIIKRYNPLSWKLLKELYEIGGSAWYHWNAMANRFSYGKDSTLKCLKELQRIGLVAVTSIFDNDRVHMCGICSCIAISESDIICARCRVLMDPVLKEDLLEFKGEVTFFGLTEAGHSLMALEKQRSFYC